MIRSAAGPWGRKQADEGITELGRGLRAWEETDTGLLRPYGLMLLTDAYATTQQTDAGVTTASMALTLVENSGERWCAPELQRLYGELRWQAGAFSEAEHWFQQALATACQQGAKMLELRTVLSLSRLWAHQGKKGTARQLLAETYQWFTEGFDAADLREAKALLDAWAGKGSTRRRALPSQR